MPELPEVEVTRLGLLKHIKGLVCTDVEVRETRFRKAVPSNFKEVLVGQRLEDIERRGKYLIWRFSDGYVFSHLGMSGTLTVLPLGIPPKKHDHIDIVFGDRLIRYHDPRRFGFLTWLGQEDPHFLPEITNLGIEPFDNQFNGKYLKKAIGTSKLPIKELLISGKAVVGVGNIYCSESLFLAGINPKTRASRISEARLERLAQTIRAVLSKSLEQGGTTLKDFVSAEGHKGYFTLHLNVYGKTGKACPVCGTPIKKIVQGGRSTFYCPKCQK